MSEGDHADESGQVALPVPGGGRARADEWALVLASQGVRSRVGAEAAGGGYALWVDAAEADYARSVLDAWQRENAEAERDARVRAEADAEPPPAEPGASGVLVGLAIVLLFFATAGRPDAYEQGSADAARIAAGQWWRAVTALCLHADIGHAVGNALFGVYFVTALGRSLGGGIAVATIVAAGTLGNLANALLQGPGHDSVGASTAVFGAIGVLSGLALARRRSFGARGRRLIVPLAAGLALLAMLGTSGARVDIGAHLGGLLAGMGLGALSAPLARRRPPATVQVLVALVTVAGVAGAWHLAGAL